MNSLPGASLIPYVVLFCIAGVPALLANTKFNKISWPIVWLIFVLFIGLRHQVGADWPSYIGITNRISRLPLSEAIWSYEILFSLLSWISSNLGFGVYGINLVGAAIFCWGLFSYCARQSNRWLALAAATPFLVVASVMSANRQGIAIGIVLLLFARWRELSLTKRTLGIVSAGLFHSSAFILLVLIIIDSRISNFRKGILMIVVVAGTLWLMDQSDTQISKYMSIYVFSQVNYSPGAIFHLLLNLIPALIILVTRKWWAGSVPNWPLLRSLCILAITMIFLVPFFTQAVGRMSLYMFPVSISFFAWLPRITANPAGRTFVRLVSIMTLLTVLVFWLTFANNAHTYLPYRNAITLDTAELELPR